MEKLLDLMSNQLIICWINILTWFVLILTPLCQQKQLAAYIKPVNGPKQYRYANISRIKSENHIPDILSVHPSLHLLIILSKDRQTTLS